MSADEIYFWWSVWLGIGGAVVLVAAALLVTILVLARRIASLALTALGVVEAIEQNTKPVWQLNATNQVAARLLEGARAILGNAGAVAQALTEAEKKRVA